MKECQKVDYRIFDLARKIFYLSKKIKPNNALPDFKLIKMRNNP